MAGARQQSGHRQVERTKAMRPQNKAGHGYGKGSSLARKNSRKLR